MSFLFGETEKKPGTTTRQIIATFTEQVDTDKEYTRSELGKILTQVFNDLKKEDKTVKKSFKKEEYINQTIKREPTSYNLFIKKNMPTLKEEFPDLSRQDLMRKVGEMWKDNKDNSLSKKYNSPKNLDDKSKSIDIKSLVTKMSSPKKTKSPPKTLSSIADEILSKSKLRPKGPPNPPPLPKSVTRVRKPLQSPRKSTSNNSPKFLDGNRAETGKRSQSPPKTNSPKSNLTKEGLEMAKSKLKRYIDPKSDNYDLEMAFRKLEKYPPNPPPLPSPPKRSSPKKSTSKLTKEGLEMAKSKLKRYIDPKSDNYDLEMAFRKLEKKTLSS